MENIIYYIDKNGNYYTDQNNNYFIYKAQQSDKSNGRMTSYILINGQFKKVKPMIAKATNLADAIGDCAFYPYTPEIF